MPTISEPVQHKVDFFSNDYLSFGTDPRVREHFLQKLSGEKHILGTGGSRYQDGTTPIVINLERRLQNFFNAPACLLFNSAYEANVGLCRALPQNGDVVIVDELVHASVHDGLRQSKARDSIIVFRHNSVEDLRKILANLVSTRTGIKGQTSSVFVVIEGIYSMHGDFAPIKEISVAMKEILPPGVGQLYVDEAHSIGILGKQGRGIVCMLGMEDDVPLRVLGFSKAMGTSGGAVLCTPTVRHYLVNSCRNLIFATTFTQSNAIAMDNAIDILESPIGDECLQGAYSTMLPLITPLVVQLAEHLRASGYFPREIMPPGVPKGHERIRWTFHAANTTQEVDEFVDVVRVWLIEQMKVKKVPLVKASL
ncbi:aminotransferase [Marasmius fiardii PR-910]|nr:aminotransferase [Marasmius fiardii PR-910]